MKDMNATPESKQKMMETLEQIHFDEEGHSVFEDDYIQDLQGEEGEEPSGSGRDILFEDLSASKKKNYQRAADAGKFNHMIESWNPWWTRPHVHNVLLIKYGTQLVQPLEERALLESLVVNEDMLFEEASCANSEIPSSQDTPLQAKI